MHFINNDIFEEMEIALNEIGAEIVYIDFDREVIKISVDIRLRSQAYLIIEDIRKKYIIKEIKKKANDPFSRVMDLFDEIYGKE